jgi:hypothetical protein
MVRKLYLEIYSGDFELSRAYRSATRYYTPQRPGLDWGSPSSTCEWIFVSWFPHQPPSHSCDFVFAQKPVIQNATTDEFSSPARLHSTAGSSLSGREMHSLTTYFFIQMFSFLDCASGNAGGAFFTDAQSSDMVES